MSTDMTGKRIVGVSRGSEFSPNHISNDARIFQAVVASLTAQGYTVETYSEREFVTQEVTNDVIFNMARAGDTLCKLKAMEDAGALVINSAYGIENCIRQPMTELLLSNGIPYPRSWVLQTSEVWSVDTFPCWIKRGDSHTIVKEDVCYVTNAVDAERVMAYYRAQHIPTAVVNEHLRGDLVKFYGVQGTDFFYWFYPSIRTHSKFGLEVYNGEAQGIQFSLDDLRSYCDRAAQVLHVPIYGGDCIVKSDGTPWIIDFNDWPSYARCCALAAPKIAECIHNHISLHW